MGLKLRIVPVLLWDERGAVKGRQFNPGRCIGSMLDRVRLLERRDIDELIILDIAATPAGRGPRFDQVEELCDGLFMPVTVGGGIRSVDDMRRLLNAGADKLGVCTAAIDRPALIDEAARALGSQAIVAAIDHRAGDVYSRCGLRRAGKDAVGWAREVEQRGAGEILLTAIDRDGTLSGYDLDTIADVAAAVDIPVIANGGCGSYDDMALAVRAGAHAVAVGAAFQFREMTPKGAARHLAAQGIATRI